MTQNRRIVFKGIEMNQSHVCPRRLEVFSPDDHTLDSWREDSTCSFCGSLNPDALMESLESGEAELGPTDKNYKVYVHRPNPNVGKRRVSGIANYKPSGDNWIELTEELANELVDGGELNGRLFTVGDYILFGEEPEKTHEKFYFQHFTPGQRVRFIELLNTKKVKISYPGYFYRLPFFCEVVE